VRNPYLGLPKRAFWRRSVAGLPAEEVDPVSDVPFTIGRTDTIATAGSCFAQHIAKTLVKAGFHYLVTERTPATAHATDENIGVFPARFGNVYSVRQLRQLFQRAYGLFEPVDDAWQRADGRWIDPFRPRIQDAGFPSPEAVAEDRVVHLAAVRAMFETCDVFVFTLGLTETWIAREDGAVFPLSPGVEAPGRPDGDYAFHNFSVLEMVADLTAFLADLRTVNPGVRVILTVSPVPLIATYETRHVLQSTVYSKSALRVVAEEIVRSHQGVAYFPSFEIITGPHTRSRFFAEDLREVTDEGVQHVMALFRRHYLSDDTAAAPRPVRTEDVVSEGTRAAVAERLRSVQAVVCDEEALDRG